IRNHRTVRLWGVDVPRLRSPAFRALLDDDASRMPVPASYARRRSCGLRPVLASYETHRIHPMHRTLEVLRLYRGKWRTLAVHRHDERVRAAPFEAIGLDLALLRATLSRTGQPSRASAHEGHTHHSVVAVSASVHIIYRTPHD